jgi:hypothetical protein
MLLSFCLFICLLLLPQSLADDNLVRLTVPAVASTLRNVTATHAVHVRAGTNSGTNYGTLTTMCVGSSSATHTSTYASVMRFSVANPSTLTSAVLALTVSSLSATLTENMPMLLLGIKDNSWTSTSATWTSLTGEHPSVLQLLGLCALHAPARQFCECAHDPELSDRETAGRLFSAHVFSGAKPSLTPCAAAFSPC